MLYFDGGSMSYVDVSGNLELSSVVLKRSELYSPLYVVVVKRGGGLFERWGYYLIHDYVRDGSGGFRLGKYYVVIIHEKGRSPDDGEMVREVTGVYEVRVGDGESSADVWKKVMSVFSSVVRKSYDEVRKTVRDRDVIEPESVDKLNSDLTRVMVS